MRVKAWQIIAGACIAIVIGNAPGIVAEASAGPSPECLEHLARVGKTEAQDQRYWLERGQLPRKCPLREEASTPSEASTPETKRDNETHDDKSWYCKRRWFC